MFFVIGYVVVIFMTFIMFLRSDISKAGKLHDDKTLRYTVALIQALAWPLVMIMGVIFGLHLLVNSFLTTMIYHLVLPDDLKKCVFSDKSNVLDYIYIQDGE